MSGEVRWSLLCFPEHVLGSPIQGEEAGGRWARGALLN